MTTGDHTSAVRPSRAAAMLAACFPQQQRAILDPCRLKVDFCTRRAGKSWKNGIYLLLSALAYPGSSGLYLGLTKGTAHAIMNKDVLRVQNERFGIGARWKTDGSQWVLPNGSIIYLRGADANAYEISKVVGQKYRAAVLDEASKYRYNVHDMVYGSLIPAMGDDLGTVVLAGTPSNITTGLFYEATTSGFPGWTVHRWTWRDNLPKLTNLTRAHDDLVRENPAIVGTPLYKQEWLGQWVVDTSALVYRFRQDLNTVAELPKPREQYTYLLGVDLGFSDPSALVVVAYHEHDPTLYVVYAQARAGQTISDVAQWIRSLWYMPSAGCRGPYPFAAMVADASALQGVEEMRQHHHLPLEAAEKPGKRGVIEVLNADLQTARVKLLPGCEALSDEWERLIWDPKKLELLPKRYEEHPAFPNHLADAALYAWRKARNFDALPAPAPAPMPGTEAWEAARLEREIAQRARLHAEGGVLLDELPPWLREVDS